MTKVAFIGTVISSYHALEELIQNGVEITSVFTLAKEHATNVSDFADLTTLCEDHGVPCHTFKHVSDRSVYEKLTEQKPDYLFVIGLSQILGEELLQLPKKGCIGAHPSLLPEGRGRAYIPWTILMEPRVAGVSLFYLDEGVDSGAIIGQSQFDLAKRETAITLYMKVADHLRKIIRDITPALKNGNLEAVPQDESRATYTAKRVPHDGMIDWDNMNTHEVDKLIRATGYPYPGAYTYYKKQKLIIWRATPISSKNYTAIPGQILEKKDDNSVWIKTTDGILSIEEVGFKGETLKAGEVVTAVGHKLGVNLAQLLEEILS